MKSTKDNRPAVKFSDIVKELHSYANSEQAVNKIFIKLTVNSVHPADSSKSNEEKVFDIIHSYQDKYGFYYNLCKLVDWYPKTLKILSIQNENLSCFGKVSYINQL